MATTRYVKGVFSGSGMDLLDHAGAVWGLDEVGYRFTALAGVSGGSIIASALACGYTPGPVLNMMLMNFLPVSTKLLDPELKFPWQKTAKKGLKDATPWWWPFASHGVVKGDKLEKALDTKFRARGVVSFKDVKIPLKVFTTDTTSGAVIEWSTEKTPDATLAPVVVASCRIPGIFQAAVFDGHDHVDGGVWNNFPLDCFGNANDTIGFFFGDGTKAGDGLDYWANIINIMMASRMEASIKAAPKASVLRLKGGNSLDFGIQGTKASEKIEAARVLARGWASRQF